LTVAVHDHPTAEAQRGDLPTGSRQKVPLIPINRRPRITRRQPIGIRTANNDDLPTEQHHRVALSTTPWDVCCALPDSCFGRMFFKDAFSSDGALLPRPLVRCRRPRLASTARWPAFAAHDPNVLQTFSIFSNSADDKELALESESLVIVTRGERRGLQVNP
jgi:hypothetical protein